VAHAGRLPHRARSAHLCGIVTTERVRALVETLWQYHRLGHQLAPADAILVLCSHDLAIAGYAAGLFREGWAPLLVCSGGLGSITKHLWSEPEADQFARIAAGIGVPGDRILVENRSTNTGQNVEFTRALLDQLGLHPQSFLLVLAPYMERRGYATFARVWPGPRVIVASPRVSFDEYAARFANPALSRDDLISIVAGDLQRIRSHAQKGFQIEQEIPADVWAAFEELVALGYDRYLVRE
jgi:uncharacterized SAM-binding protein YcdF (DUF218 family)